MSEYLDENNEHKYKCDFCGNEKSYEEAIKLVKEVTGMSLDWDDAHYEALQMAIKALEQQSTLDKIRAEIAMYEDDCRLQGGTDECEKCNSNVFGSIYRIIDKYKAESEV